MKKYIIASVFFLISSFAVATPPIYGPLMVQNNLDEITQNGTQATAQVNLFGYTISLGGNFATSGANSLTFTTTGTTNVTLPTSGTLLNSSSSISYTQLPALSANQLLGALTATTPSGQSVPSCSTSSSALQWSSGVGFACNSSINAATLGGATFASPGSIGSGTANTGAFTNLSSSGTVSGTGFSNYLASPPPIGGTSASSGRFTTLTATSTVTGIGLIGIQVFTSSGTYTADAGTQSIISEVVGQGGGGGGCASTSSTQNCAAAPGGSGSYAKVYYTSGFTPETITIGTSGSGGAAGSNNGISGSTASFGSLISCPGGTAGSAGSVTTDTLISYSNSISSQPSACTISGGTTILSIKGSSTGPGQVYQTLGATISPQGGSSPLGSGGSYTLNSANAGNSGSGFGAGGSGAISTNSGAAEAGGNPSGGAVIIFEFN